MFVPASQSLHLVSKIQRPQLDGVNLSVVVVLEGDLTCSVCAQACVSIPLLSISNLNPLNAHFPVSLCSAMSITDTNGRTMRS